MTFDNCGALVTLDGAELDHGPCNNFDSYCFTATMFKEKGLYAECRRALSEASALVEHMLRAEHPRTLACFLEVFTHLMQTGLPEVASVLRGYIKSMSETVIKKGHPWGQICWLLGEIDSDCLYQAMAQIWKSMTDTFESKLGPDSRFAISVRLDCIKRVATNCEEERLLRELLAQVGVGGLPALSIPRVILNLAHNLSRQGCHMEAEGIALDVLSLLKGNQIYAQRIVERIESLKVIAFSRFSQGRTGEAEQSMQEAIGMVVKQWGMRHSWVPELGWLQIWGRNEDANALHERMAGLMRKDEDED